MTLTEYAQLAQRTASTKTKEEKIGHGILGLIGEAGEIIDIIKKQKYMGMPEDLAQEKLVDEAGDYMWYLVELCTGFELNVEDVFTVAVTWHTFVSTVEEAAVELVGRSADLYDYDDENVLDIDSIYDAVCCYLDMLELAKIDKQQVLIHNIKKLKKRYPEGFSTDRSNVRYEQ